MDLNNLIMVFFPLTSSHIVLSLLSLSIIPLSSAKVRSLAFPARFLFAHFARIQAVFKKRCKLGRVPVWWYWNRHCMWLMQKLSSWLVSYCRKLNHVCKSPLRHRREMEAIHYRVSPASTCCLLCPILPQLSKALLCVESHTGAPEFGLIFNIEEGEQKDG